MKRSSLFVLMLALGFACPAAEPSAAVPADVPGSASMPPAVLASGLPKGLPAQGGARCGLWIRPDGTVEEVEILGAKKTPRPWHDALRDAIMAWKFRPVEWEGKALPARVEVSILFLRDSPSVSFSPVPNLPNETHAENEFGLKPAAIRRDPDQIIPLSDRAARGRTEAGFRFVVEKDGETGRFVPLGATSEAAVRSVLNVIGGQRYLPATVRGEPVPMEQKVVLSMLNTEPIEALDGIKEGFDPVYPYDRLLAGESGKAAVRFVLGREGRVTGCTVTESTHPEFGLALRAAVVAWTFSEEAAASKPQREFTYEFEFQKLPGGVERLLGLLKAGKEISNRGAGLESRPQREAAPALVFPPEFLARKTAGSAQVEFIIDRTGLAQLPRLLAASDPDLGWAALQWVGSTRFKPLRRNGEATDLRIVLPVGYKPKPEDAPAQAQGTSQ